MHLSTLDRVEELELLRFKISDSIDRFLHGDSLFSAFPVATLSHLGHLFVHECWVQLVTDPSSSTTQAHIH